MPKAPATAPNRNGRKPTLPGYRWRLLAWPDGAHESFHLESLDYENQRFDQATREIVPTASNLGRLLLDEVVIDDWFHLEQIDDRQWWMRIGNLTVNVTIPAKGEPHVTTEWDR